MKRKCYICANEMKKMKTSVKGYKAYLCPRCGERVFSADEVKKILSGRRGNE